MDERSIMKESGFASSMIQSIPKFWHRLVQASPELDEENRPLSRVLNGMLLILVIVGGIGQTEFIVRRDQINPSEIIVITVLLLF
ncbi:MAG TPA: hypothetical protein VKE92_13875, partial [Anaerolineales bacterium]|nr:hypothetical protein [Anaerolineales bacterium]